MRPNLARQRLAAGQPILGATVSAASPLVAETMGHLGYDWVLLDLQHGENNLGNLATVLGDLAGLRAGCAANLKAVREAAG